MFWLYVWYIRAVISIRVILKQYNNLIIYPNVVWTWMSIIFSLGWLCAAAREKSVTRNGVPLTLFRVSDLNVSYITISPTSVSAFPTDIRLHLNNNPYTFHWLGGYIKFHDHQRRWRFNLSPRNNLRYASGYWLCQSRFSLQLQANSSVSLTNLDLDLL